MPFDDGDTPGWPRQSPDGPPDVVGMPVREALARLEAYRCTLAFTAPPRPKGEPGAVRVVAQRVEEGQVRLLCAREYYDNGPVEPPDGAGQRAGDEGEAAGLE